MRSASCPAMNRPEDNQKTSKTQNNMPAAQERAKAEATPTAPNQGDGVGEGNRAATHRYNDGLAKSVARGDSDALAEEAKRAVDGPEGAELEEAEETAKRGEPKVTSRR